MNQVEIYLKTNSNYKANGDITLSPISCIYKDSEQEVKLEHPIDNEGRWKYIQLESMIAVYDEGKRKLFRIYNITKTLDTIIAYARPPFYDLLDTILFDVRPTDKNGQEALDIILKDTGFTGHSNISALNTSYFVRKNIVNALVGDDENSFINRWGGEFYTENFDVYINDRIGSDNGVRVEFGYNLEGIEEDINIEEVVTRIIPMGYNGLTYKENVLWIVSPLIDKYAVPKARVIEFPDVKVKEKPEDKDGFNTIEEAREELQKRAIKLFEEGIDKPLVNYKVSMIGLENTTAYEDVKKLVKVRKGDTVTCYVPHLDIDVKARVIDFEKDLLTGKYISIELGNVVNNFIKDQVDIQSKVNNILDELVNTLKKDDKINASNLNGIINALNVQFKALRDMAQPQEVRAFLFEDRLEGSPTFGAMTIGTMGFQIAHEFKPGTTDWDWRTFGTGKGFFADLIVAGTLMADLIKAGILESANGKTWINMETGEFNFADRLKLLEDNRVIFTGEIINESNGYGVNIHRGAVAFTNGGKNIGGIVATQKIDDQNRKGITIGGTANAEYISFGVTASEALEPNTISEFSPIFEIDLKNKNVSISKNSLMEQVVTSDMIGSTKQTAERITNLNSARESGWYAFSDGAIGAPVNYGILLHFRWSATANDCVQLCVEVGTGRLFTRGSSENGKYWTDWSEK